MPQAIKGIIFDLDGTLHRDDGDAMEEAYEIAGAKAAVDLGAPLTFEQARIVARNAFAEHGLYLKGFQPYGIGAQDYHFQFHNNLDEMAIETVPGVREAMEASGVDNAVLLTHASRHWAQRALIRLDLEDRFPPERIVAFEDYGFRSKSSHDLPFQMTLAILKVPAAEIAVIEDSPRNLEIPFRLGMQTFLVNYRRPEAPKADHVGYQIPSVIAALAAIRQINAEPAAIATSVP